MTPHATPLDQWLSDATRGLSAESTARVRAEIQQHYDSACEAGADALAALGDPRAANRAYRKVLLTEQEATMAPSLTQPKRRSLPAMLLTIVLPAAVVSWLGLASKHHDPGFWPVMIAIFCTTPLRFFPRNTLERVRIHVRVRAVGFFLVVATTLWFQGSESALILGSAMSVVLFLNYFLAYRTLLIFRKLAAGQTYSLLPGEPELTHLEAIYLRALQKGGGASENVPVTLLFAMLAGLAVWMPATFAPMAIWTAAGYLSRRTLPIYTEARSRWLRIARWTTMAVAAVLPALYGARAPWVGAAQLAMFFVLLDMPGISLRRKLPVAEWPKRLYW